MMTGMARKINQGSKWIRPDKRLAIYLRDGLACAYCGSSQEHDGAVLTLDHVVAQELGGGSDEGNLVTACLGCNSAKRALTLRAFLVYLRDQGIDTAGTATRIRRNTNRELAAYRAEAKRIIARR